MKIPDKKECFIIINDNKMMDHIIKHSMMVRSVASLLCSNLIKTFPELNIKLAKSAGLLHDITKTQSFTTGEKHSETGARLLAELGFPETGDIVRQHVFLDNYNTNPPVTEAEIINYSDKRVLHDSVVPLNERLDYIYKKYVTNKEFIKHFDSMEKNTYILEIKIFSYLDFRPNDLQKMI
ncbi:MAG: HDIG domain-containing protein [Desulfobacteraceae bacterium]|nr:HDIG domain-containing protein [Desulfobacteraceae bacterium]MCK5542928.1 HDIG domain-containing protein [Desulfobacterales bacterium]